MKTFTKKRVLIFLSLFIVGYLISFLFSLNKTEVSPSNVTSSNHDLVKPIDKKSNPVRTIASENNAKAPSSTIDWPIKDESALGLDEQKMIVKQAEDAISNGIIKKDDKEKYILEEREILLNQLKADNEGPADRNE